MIPDKEFLTVDKVLEVIKENIEQHKPFSLVRVGDGENIILAQGSVLPIGTVLIQQWAKEANQGKKGVTLPNYKIRDDMVKAIKRAHMVGIPFLKNDPILTLNYLKRPLTDKAFNFFGIRPNLICHTLVNRVLSQKEEFWNLLKGRRILLISQWADEAKEILQRKPYGLEDVSTLPFTHYSQMSRTLKDVTEKKNDFDIALISCGVNAVILAQQIAELTGKVTIDFGKSLMFMVQKKAGLEYDSSQAHKNLLL